MILFTVFAISAAIIGLSDCCLNFALQNLNEDRIIGGRTAAPGQFPYQVSLRCEAIDNGTIGWFGHICGGSIIGRNWIVTAAHCTQGFQGHHSHVAVVVGAHRQEKYGILYLMDKVFVNPSYRKKSAHYDISLLRTIDKMNFNEFVRPIPLRRQFVDAGATAIVSGWGYTEFTPTHKSPTHLQFLRVQTVTNAACLSRQTGERRDYIYNGTLCAYSGATGKGICRGDSGGPLASNGQLVGIVSWGLPCARGVPDGYTRISTFLAWIQNVTGIVAV